MHWCGTGARDLRSHLCDVARGGQHIGTSFDGDIPVRYSRLSLMPFGNLPMVETLYEGHP